MRKRSHAAAAAIPVVVSLLTATSASAHPRSDDWDDSPQAAATAHVWVTTPDGAKRFSDEGTVTFTDAASTAPTVVVDPKRTYQVMTGFGASITDSSAAVLYRLKSKARDAVMRDLFDPVKGDGLSFLRQPIGASDFVDEPAYTYDDVPAGKTDYLQKHFSVAHDEAQILPLVRRAQQLNPELSIMATPWSPPAWMKTPPPPVAGAMPQKKGSLVGGKLIDDPKIYASYALYLTKFVQAYKARGVDIDYISVQNEPQNRTPGGYPGTDLGSAQEIKIINVLGPMLRAAHLHTKILGYDHNWAIHPNDISGATAGEENDATYAENILDSEAAPWVSGTAFHCYYGDPSAMTAFHNQFPDKDIFFTECSGGISKSGPAGAEVFDPAKTFNDTLRWHARNIIIGNTRNWAKTVVNWNLALDEIFGPHVGGCATCPGVVTIAANGTVTKNAEYYGLGHLSRFVRPGAVRIASTSFGNTAWNGNVTDVAFKNPDGSTVLVAHNELDDPREFAVQENGQTFTYTLPGGALATFVWDEAPRASEHLTQLDPSDWTITGDPAGPATGDIVTNAIDDDASTKYKSGTSQATGQYIQVDLGRSYKLQKFVVDAGAEWGMSSGDYARGYSVSVSRNGTTWTEVESGAGTGELTTIDMDGTYARYVKFSLTADAGNWLSVADIRAYVGNNR